MSKVVEELKEFLTNLSRGSDTVDAEDLLNSGIADTSVILNIKQKLGDSPWNIQKLIDLGIDTIQKDNEEEPEIKNDSSDIISENYSYNTSDDDEEEDFYEKYIKKEPIELIEKTLKSLIEKSIIQFHPVLKEFIKLLIYLFSSIRKGSKQSSQETRETFLEEVEPEMINPEPDQDPDTDIESLHEYTHKQLGTSKQKERETVDTKSDKRTYTMKDVVNKRKNKQKKNYNQGKRIGTAFFEEIGSKESFVNEDIFNQNITHPFYNKQNEMLESNKNLRKSNVKIIDHTTTRTCSGDDMYSIFFQLNERSKCEYSFEDITHAFAMENLIQVCETLYKHLHKVRKLQNDVLMKKSINIITTLLYITLLSLGIYFVQSKGLFIKLYSFEKQLKKCKEENEETKRSMTERIDELLNQIKVNEKYTEEFDIIKQQWGETQKENEKLKESYSIIQKLKKKITLIESEKAMFTKKKEELEFIIKQKNLIIESCRIKKNEKEMKKTEPKKTKLYLKQQDPSINKNRTVLKKNELIHKITAQDESQKEEEGPEREREEEPEELIELENKRMDDKETQTERKEFLDRKYSSLKSKDIGTGNEIKMIGKTHKGVQTIKCEEGKRAEKNKTWKTQNSLKDKEESETNLMRNKRMKENKKMKNVLSEIEITKKGITTVCERSTQTERESIIHPGEYLNHVENINQVEEIITALYKLMHYKMISIIKQKEMKHRGFTYYFSNDFVLESFLVNNDDTMKYTQNYMKKDYLEEQIVYPQNRLIETCLKEYNKGGSIKKELLIQYILFEYILEMYKEYIHVDILLILYHLFLNEDQNRSREYILMKLVTYCESQIEIIQQMKSTLFLSNSNKKDNSVLKEEIFYSNYFQYFILCDEKRQQSFRKIITNKSTNNQSYGSFPLLINGFFIKENEECLDPLEFSIFKKVNNKNIVPTEDICSFYEHFSSSKKNVLNLTSVNENWYEDFFLNSADPLEKLNCWKNTNKYGYIENKKYYNYFEIDMLCRRKKEYINRISYEETTIFNYKIERIHELIRINKLYEEDEKDSKEKQEERKKRNLKVKRKKQSLKKYIIPYRPSKKRKIQFYTYSSTRNKTECNQKFKELIFSYYHRKQEIYFLEIIHSKKEKTDSNLPSDSNSSKKIQCTKTYNKTNKYSTFSKSLLDNLRTFHQLPSSIGLYYFVLLNEKSSFYVSNKDDSCIYCGKKKDKAKEENPINQPIKKKENLYKKPQGNQKEKIEKMCSIRCKEKEKGNNPVLTRNKGKTRWKKDSLKNAILYDSIKYFEKKRRNLNQRERYPKKDAWLYCTNNKIKTILKEGRYKDTPKLQRTHFKNMFLEIYLSHQYCIVTTRKHTFVQKNPCVLQFKKKQMKKNLQIYLRKYKLNIYNKFNQKLTFSVCLNLLENSKKWSRQIFLCNLNKVYKKKIHYSNDDLFIIVKREKEFQGNDESEINKFLNKLSYCYEYKDWYSMRYCCRFSKIYEEFSSFQKRTLNLYKINNYVINLLNNGYQLKELRNQRRLTNIDKEFYRYKEKQLKKRKHYHNINCDKYKKKNFTKVKIKYIDKNIHKNDSYYSRVLSTTNSIYWITYFILLVCLFLLDAYYLNHSLCSCIITFLFVCLLLIASLIRSCLFLLQIFIHKKIFSQEVLDSLSIHIIKMMNYAKCHLYKQNFDVDFI